MTKLTCKSVLRNSACLIVSFAALFSVSNAVAASTAIDHCATSAQKLVIADAYPTRLGAPPMILARELSMPEQTLVSGLPGEVVVYGAQATPQRVKDVWATIDQWGAETNIHAVFTMGGGHVADFPTLVPITQPDDGSGFIDVYADEGRGVHGHVYLEDVKSIFSAEMSGDGGATRAVSFYNAEGGLIVGVYASIIRKDFDQAAIDGFAVSAEKIKEYPALCQ